MKARFEQPGYWMILIFFWYDTSPNFSYAVYTESETAIWDRYKLYIDVYSRMGFKIETQDTLIVDHSGPVICVVLPIHYYWVISGSWILTHTIPHRKIWDKNWVPLIKQLHSPKLILGVIDPMKHRNLAIYKYKPMMIPQKASCNQSISLGTLQIFAAYTSQPPCLRLPDLFTPFLMQW